MAYLIENKHTRAAKVFAMIFGLPNKSPTKEMGIAVKKVDGVVRVANFQSDA